MKNRVMSGEDIQQHEGFKPLVTPSKITGKEEDITLILNDTHLKLVSFRAFNRHSLNLSSLIELRKIGCDKWGDMALKR